ncbi:hypothetical protein LG301_15725 [Vreelandella venusta]|uniref:hypothetical protein n=1 Tax=Vreelandella venusta TaxID=44935 RepID=UPI00384FDB10
MEIGAAVTAVKGALDLARNAKDVNDRAQLNAAMSDIMGKLTTAQSDLLDLLSEHYRLLDENRDLKQKLTKEERFEKYQMEKTAQGHFVMKLKDEFISDGNPPHAICHLCKDSGKFTIMDEGKGYYVCPACNYIARLNPAPRITF